MSTLKSIFTQVTNSVNGMLKNKGVTTPQIQANQQQAQNGNQQQTQNGNKHRSFKVMIGEWFMKLTMPSAYEIINRENDDRSTKYNSMTVSGDDIAANIIDLKNTEKGTPEHEAALEQLGEIYRQTSKDVIDAYISDEKRAGSLMFWTGKIPDETIKEQANKGFSLSNDELEALGQQLVDLKAADIEKHISDIGMTPESYVAAVKNGEDIANAMDRNELATLVDRYGDIAFSVGSNYDNEYAKARKGEREEMSMTKAESLAKAFAKTSGFSDDELDAAGRYGEILNIRGRATTTEELQNLDDKMKDLKEQFAQMNSLGGETSLGELYSKDAETSTGEHVYVDRASTFEISEPSADDDSGLGL